MIWRLKKGDAWDMELLLLNRMITCSLVPFTTDELVVDTLKQAVPQCVLQMWA